MIITKYIYIYFNRGLKGPEKRNDSTQSKTQNAQSTHMDSVQIMSANKLINRHKPAHKVCPKSVFRLYIMLARYPS